MKPRVPPILRPAQRFPPEDPAPTAADFECEQCGEWLEPDGQCETCDLDEDSGD